MPRDWVASIAAYFDTAASEYPSAIEPAVGPLAAGLVEFAQIASGELVLDLGAGTGLAAREAARRARGIIGVDISRAMLAAAGRGRAWSAVQGDMHRLPFRRAQFDAVLAAFALNSSDPRAALAEAHRVLRPGGRIVLQEWDAIDDLTDVIADTVAEYAVEDPPPALATLRARMQAPIPWDEIESLEDLVRVIEQAGFGDVEAQPITPTVLMPGVEAFVRYKLAWPIRRAELEAMTPEVRRLCLSDLRENLGAHADPDGTLAWRPAVIRVRAYRVCR